MTTFWQAAFALLMFLLLGAGVLAVMAPLSRSTDDRLAEWDDAEADDIRRANPSIDRWVSRDGIAAELDADRADLPYGGGWGA